MNIIVNFAITAAALIFSLINNISAAYALALCWILFAASAMRKGRSLKDVFIISFNSSKQAAIVLQVFLLIGAVIGVWMASGTVPSIVYYCMHIIQPGTVILSAFVIGAVTSFTTGTSFGTISIVGIPLMIICRAGGVNPDIAAGAIIAGAYFGDRCSFMSSSAMLVASITGTDIFSNVKLMLRDSAVPVALSLLFYLAVSKFNPLAGMNDALQSDIAGEFGVRPILLLPAAIILVLSVMKVSIKISMSASIVCAFVLGAALEGRSFAEMLGYAFFGFTLSPESPLVNIVRGGGIMSMLSAAAVIFISCALTGLFNELKLLDRFKDKICGMSLKKHSLFALTSAVGIVSAAVGCNQSISIVMTEEIMEKPYSRQSKQELAMAIENSAVLLSGLVPWCVAALVPTATLGVSMVGYMPYAFFMYIFPVVYYFKCMFVDRKVLEAERE